MIDTEKRPLPSDPAVTRHDTPTIMDGVVVRYQVYQSEISASRNKVLVADPIGIRTRDDLRRVLLTICRAFVQYGHLEPNQCTLVCRTNPLVDDAVEPLAEQLLVDMAMPADLQR